MSEKGTVKWFSPRKGYGFIIRDGLPEEENEIFVHYSSIVMDGFKTLMPGNRVEYNVGEGRSEGSIEAKEVKIIPNIPVKKEEEKEEKEEESKE